MAKIYKNYIIFKVVDLVCALDCLDVQEIIRDTKNLTGICRSDDYVSGVLNLRGEIVSVIDLQKFFNMGTDEIQNATIVVKYEKEHIGFMVTSILDVIEQALSSVESSPAVPNGMNPEHIKGVFELNGKLVTVLNVEGIVALDEVAVGGSE
jgi:purine-binding chemotaxis protein CheW